MKKLMFTISLLLLCGLMIFTLAGCGVSKETLAEAEKTADEAGYKRGYDEGYEIGYNAGWEGYKEQLKKPVGIVINDRLINEGTFTDRGTEYYDHRIILTVENGGGNGIITIRFYYGYTQSNGEKYETGQSAQRYFVTGQQRDVDFDFVTPIGVAWSQHWECITELPE
jgi:hypothetical protein